MDNVMIKSATNRTVVVFIPDIPLNKIWKKKGSMLPIERKVLIQAYYDPSVEFLFKNGILTTDDKDFLQAVGLADEDGQLEVITLTDTVLKRYISAMPLAELKQEILKLTHIQVEELAQYAIEHYTILNNDRIELLSKASNIDIIKAV